MSRDLKRRAAAAIAAGPPPLDEATERRLRYFVSDVLDDVRAPRSTDELLGAGARLYEALADYHLRRRGKWSGKGKSIPRALAHADERLKARYCEAFGALFGRADQEPVIRLAEELLSEAGGPLFEGYRADAPEDWRAPDLVRAPNFRMAGEKLRTCGQPDEDQLASARDAGVDVVINLALHDDPRYSLRDERGCVERLGMAYVHIPVQFGAPAETDLLAFFEAMQVHRGRSILVHCAANYRVSAFVGLYNAVRLNEPADQAFRLMDTLWQPDAVWRRFIDAMLAKYGHWGSIARRDVEGME